MMIQVNSGVGAQAQGAAFRVVAGLLLTAIAATAQANVTLNAATSPAEGQPETTNFSITGTGYPTGTVQPEAVSIALEPASAGAGPSLTLTPTAVTTVVGSTRRLSFRVPATLALSSATPYLLSVSGATTTGTTFASGNKAQITIVPTPVLLSTAPSKLQPGQTVAVVLRANLTNFLQGVTSARFGAGTSVGGGPVGDFGPVIVISPTSALAVVRAEAVAATGNRDVEVRTGAQTVSLQSGSEITTAATGIQPNILALTSPTTPATGQPGRSTIQVDASGFASTAVAASNVKVLLEPAVAGAGPTIVAVVDDIDATVASQRSLTFPLPGNLAVAGPVSYLVTVFGSTGNFDSASYNFASSNKASLTLVPSVGISTLVPGAAPQGASSTVQITGQFTNFQNGKTQANFGAGIEVGGGAPGGFGPVTVTSATTATANIVVSPAATVGTRNVQVRTGIESALLQNGFSVTPGSLQVSVAAPVPSIAAPGVPFTLAVTGLPAGALANGSATLSMVPSVPGAGPSATLIPISITDAGTGIKTFTFTVPASISIVAPVDYRLSLSGIAPGGLPFSTQSAATLKVTPPPTVSMLTPNSAAAGTSVAVKITGSYTSFATGITTASFGPGIAVGGGVAGGFGPVVVESATTATAQLQISPQAATGPRTLIVRSGSQEATLTGGFNVTSATSVLTISSVSPASVTPPLAIVITATGFPSGNIGASNLKAVFEASGKPAIVLPVNAVTGNGTERQVGVSIPASMVADTATTYQVSLSGSTAEGTALSTGTKGAITILPQALISSVLPNTAAAGSSISLVVTGVNTNFSAASTFSLGPGITVVSKSIASPTSATLSITVANSATHGPRTLTVTTGGVSVTMAQALTISAAPADILSVTPASGIRGRAYAVTVIGANTSFAQGNTQFSFGPDISVGQVVVQSPVSATANITVAPDATPGTRDVTVTTGAEIVKKTGGFLILSAPVISRVDPSSGTAGTSLTVAITGNETNFTANTVFTFGAGITVKSKVVNSTTSATVTIDISANAAAGPRTVVATTAAEQASLSAAFTVRGMPTLLSIVPQSGAAGTTLNVTLTGQNTNFAQGVTTLSAGDGITISDINVASKTSLTAKFVIAEDAAAGMREVSAKTEAEQVSRAEGFRVATAGPQAISQVDPNVGQPGETVQLTLTGVNTQWTQDATSFAFGSGITVGAKTVSSPTSAKLTITIASDATIGPRTIVATTGSQSVTRTEGFRVISGAVITRVEPASGIAGTALTVLVTGSGTSFNGSTSFGFGDAVTVSDINVTSPSTATMKLTIAAAAAKGTRDVSATTAGEQAKLAAAFKVTGPAPIISITSPTAQALYATNRTTVTGSVNDSSAAVMVNGVTANVVGTTFTAANVALVEGVNILTATATNVEGVTGSAAVSVVLDVTSPIIRVDTPSDGATLTTTATTISGMVNDIVSGTVNLEQVQVTVNGRQAVVSNRTFELRDFLLVRGENVLTARAVDRAGNVGTSTIKLIVRSEAAQQRIVMVSGNDQTAVIGSTLPNPLVVQLLGADGNPLADRPVTFRVRRSDGILKAPPQLGQEINLRTDSSGNASVILQLGTRTGAGMNQVEVLSPGFQGETIFCATSTVGAPFRIRNAGVMTTVPNGVVGKPLAMPFQVIVFDQGGNPVSNVSVNFKVEQGGGNLGSNQTSVTKRTDGDGKTDILLTVGEQEGIANNVVSANFEGSTDPPLLFLASGVVQGVASSTKVSGIVIDNQNKPIPGATAKIVGSPLSALTDADGKFSIGGAPVGTITLIVDGATSTRPEKFPFLAFHMQVIAGQDNTIGMPISIPFIDEPSSKIVGGNEEVVLTMKDVPGVAFTIAPNSATFPDGTRVGRMSLSQVHADKVPMPPPYGTAPRVVWTLQPANVKFDPPIRVQLPNTDNLTPGQVVEIFQFDHDLEQFVSVGMARVSPDGSVMVTDAGFGITKSGWGTPAPPPPPEKCILSCNSTSVCSTSGKAPNSCSCVDKPANEGGKCGSDPGKDSCRENGVCRNGSCSEGSVRRYGDCDDGKKCTESDSCDLAGACYGNAKPSDMYEQAFTFGKVDLIRQKIASFGATVFGKVLPIPRLEAGGSRSWGKACCEEKNGELLETESWKASIAVTADPIDFTLAGVNKSFSFAGQQWTVALGLWGQIGFGIGGEFGSTDDKCQENSCGFASVGVSVPILLEAGGQIPNPVLSTCGPRKDQPCNLIKVTGTASSGVGMKMGGTCEEVSLGFSWDGLSLGLVVALFEGTWADLSVTTIKWTPPSLAGGPIGDPIKWRYKD